MQARDPKPEMRSFGVPRPLEQRLKEAGQWEWQKGETAAAHRTIGSRVLGLELQYAPTGVRPGPTRRRGPTPRTPCSASGVSASCQTHCGQWHNRFCFNPASRPPINRPTCLTVRAHRLETDDDVDDDCHQTLVGPLCHSSLDLPAGSAPAALGAPAGSGSRGTQHDWLR
jgi:hypothetical protein